MNKYLLLLALLFSFSITAQVNNQHQKDSLRKVIEQEEGAEKLNALNRIANIYFMESRDSLKMDTMIYFLNEMEQLARKEGDIDKQGIARCNILLAYNNNAQYDRILEQAPKDIEFLAKIGAWKFYSFAYKTLIGVYEKQGKFQLAIDEAQKMYKQVEKQKDIEGMAIALSSMAEIYSSQRRFPEAEAIYRQSLELLEGKDDLVGFAANLWHRLCETLFMQAKHEEMQETIRHFEKVNIRLDSIVGYTVATSWGNLWGTTARLYAKLEDFDQAEMYCNKIDSIINGRAYKKITYDVRSKVYASRGEYDKALEMVEKHKTLIPQDNWYELNEQRRMELDILRKKGDDWEKAYHILEQVYFTHDSIRTKEETRQLDELRTIYEVDKITAEKEKRRLQFLFTFVACILLLIILTGYIFYSRRLKKKNITMYRQIQEMTEKKKEAEKFLSEKTEDELSKELILFRQLRQYLDQDKKFTSLNLNRRAVADRLGTNERYLSDAVRAGANDTFSGFIANLKLQYALELLTDCPGMALDAIAIDSGHGSYSQFFRSFSKKFGINPSEYRKLAGKK